MNRYGIIKENRIKISKISSRLKNIKNYKSNSQMLRDVSRLEKAKKEIEIQECYVEFER